MISKLDPFVVLQYISSSIDVIINLKFEDIESKMIQKTQEGKDSNLGDTLGEQIKDLRQSMLEEIEVASLKSGDVVAKGRRQPSSEVESLQPEENDLEETPPQLKAKAKKNSKMGMSGQHEAQSARAGGADKSHRKDKSEASNDSFTDSSLGGPSCPRVYEEMIQQLEADVRKHIRIEHQLKLHIESVEDRVEELERDAAKAEDSTKKDESSLKDNEKEKAQLEEALNKKFEHKLKTTNEKLQKELEKSHEAELAARESKIQKYQQEIGRHLGSNEKQKVEIKELTTRLTELEGQNKKLTEKVLTLNKQVLKQNLLLKQHAETQKEQEEENSRLVYKNLNKAIPSSNKNFGGNSSLEMRNTGFGPAEDFRASEDNTLRQDQSFSQLEKQKFSSLEKINKKNKGNIHQFIQK